MVECIRKRKYLQLKMSILGKENIPPAITASHKRQVVHIPSRPGRRKEARSSYATLPLISISEPQPLASPSSSKIT